MLLTFIGNQILSDTVTKRTDGLRFAPPILRVQGKAAHKGLDYGSFRQLFMI